MSDQPSSPIPRVLVPRNQNQPTRGWLAATLLTIWTFLLSVRHLLVSTFTRYPIGPILMNHVLRIIFHIFSSSLPDQLSLQCHKPPNKVLQNKSIHLRFVDFVWRDSIFQRLHQNLKNKKNLLKNQTSVTKSQKRMKKRNQLQNRPLPLQAPLRYLLLSIRSFHLSPYLRLWASNRNWVLFYCVFYKFRFRVVLKLRLHPKRICARAAREENCCLCSTPHPIPKKVFRCSK